MGRLAGELWRNSQDSAEEGSDECGGDDEYDETFNLQDKHNTGMQADKLNHLFTLTQPQGFLTW
jgi:hypothetical protein